ncbi:MAG: hypothetical protein HC906_15425 [Bacteroidales bacterium]|nr:hypothetical protein [Bacteroidales bacterium]
MLNRIYIVLFLLAFCRQGFSQEQKINRFAVQSGYSGLIYQSRYSFDNATFLVFEVDRTLAQSFKWGGGFRVSTSGKSPEGFLRIGIFQQLGVWQPALSLESGIGKPGFDRESNLLKETSEAMVRDIGLVYLSSRAELLGFEFREKWRLSILGVNFGTHYRNFGKTTASRGKFF